MSEDTAIQCESHGEGSPAYICTHLHANPAQKWFCNYPVEEDRWPDAWCAKCEAEFQKYGEWNEHNEGFADIKAICHECYESGMAASVDAMTDAERDAWHALVRDCHEELKPKQEKMVADYKIGQHRRWDYDQETATLMFSNDGVPALIAEVEFIGGVSTKSRTWLWAWANFDMLPQVRSRIAAVREFGAERDFPHLTVPEWQADEADGWDVSAIAAKVLGAQGLYRVPSRNGFLYMAILDMRLA